MIYSDGAATPRSRAYGAHLAVAINHLRCTELPTRYEQSLLRAWDRLAWSQRDLLAKVLKRKTPLPLEQLADIPEADAQALLVSGWVQVDDGDGLVPTDRARALYVLALVCAWGDPGADGDGMVLLGVKGLTVAPGLPLAQTLAGVDPFSDGGSRPVPFNNRGHFEAWLAAREERQSGCSVDSFDAALGRVRAHQGEALPLLGHRFTPAYQATRHLQEHCHLRELQPQRRLQALRALARSPLSPSLARFCGGEWWRSAKGRGLRGRMAADLASWSIWHPGDRLRWEWRAAGTRRSPVSFNEHTVTAWLEHDAGGKVIAAGEGVEVHALRSLKKEGWEGVWAEGGLWWSLAWTFGFSAISAQIPGMWVGPCQSLPLDWAAWGFVTRRSSIIDDICREIVDSPLTAWRRACAALGGGCVPGLGPPLDPAIGEAVVTRVPPLLITRVLRLLLERPGLASGLPDLVVWRGDEVRLWEVKSPGDALSDRQRWWLGMMAEEGVHVGVLRVKHAEPTQASFLTPEVPVGKRRQRSSKGRAAGAGGPAWSLLPLAPAIRAHSAPDLDPTPWGQPWVWAEDPLLAVSAWNGHIGDAAVDGWDRPVDDVVLLPTKALRPPLQGHKKGRTISRYFPVPPGMQVAVILSTEAHPEGGLRRVGRMLTRRSGWLLPASWFAIEPVVVPLGAPLPSAGVGVDWRAHPDEEPWRPEAKYPELVEALAGQLALLADQAYMILKGNAAPLALAVADTDSVMWVLPESQVERCSLDEVCTLPVLDEH